MATHSVIEKLSNLIRTNKIVVFSKTYCPHCRAAKDSLRAANVKFHAEEIDQYNSNETEAAQNWFQEATGARTVPRVFIDGKCIGGNSDLQAGWVRTGKINELPKL
jgi:glutaredoxin 3